VRDFFKASSEWRAVQAASRVRILLYKECKTAYLVGRLVVDGYLFSLSIAFGLAEEGVVVDSVLWGEVRPDCLSSLVSRIPIAWSQLTSRRPP